jgi:hypothetical protein
MKKLYWLSLSAIGYTIKYEKHYLFSSSPLKQCLTTWHCQGPSSIGLIGAPFPWHHQIPFPGQAFVSPLFVRGGAEINRQLVMARLDSDRLN